MRRLILVLVGVLLVVGVFGLNRMRRSDTGKPLFHVAPEEALPVKVATPQRRMIERTVQAPGEIEAVREVEIRSEIPAKIEEMPVEEGDLVKAGELLCRLNDDAYRAQVESGEATVARLAASIRQAEADLAKCSLDMRRQESLAQKNAASDYEVATYRTRLLQAKAEVEVRRQALAEAEAMLRSASENLKKTVITSPIDGVVSQIHAKEGEVVVTGTMNNPGTVVMVVTDLSQMQVRTRVDETDVPQVKPDQDAYIFLPSEPQRPIPGKVLRVATSGTKQQGRDVVTFETLILVDSDDSAIKPGMTANVEIRVASKDNALTVPVQAVVHRKRKDLPADLVEAYDQRQEEIGLENRGRQAQYLKVVYTKDEDQAQPHLVRIGIADETSVELVDGIEEGQVVIVGPYRTLDQLKKETKVKLEEKPEGEQDVSKVESDTRLAEDKPGGDDESASDDAVAKAQ